MNEDAEKISYEVMRYKYDEWAKKLKLDENKKLQALSGEAYADEYVRLLQPAREEGLKELKQMYRKKERDISYIWLPKVAKILSVVFIGFFALTIWELIVLLDYGSGLPVVLAIAFGLLSLGFWSLSKFASVHAEKQNIMEAIAEMLGEMKKYSNK